MSLLLATLPLLCTPQATLERGPDRLRTQPALGSTPNIVLIVADDFGVDKVAAYGEAPSPPCTPNIDSLAEAGVSFDNYVIATPVCAAMRATFLTGMYASSTSATPGPCTCACPRAAP